MSADVLVLGASEQAPPGLPEPRTGARYRFAASAEALREHLPHADVLFVWDYRTTLLRLAWPLRRRLRWIELAGVGVDAFLFPELVESEVVLTNARGVFDQTMAEYALGLMLLFAKDFPRTLALQRERRWEHRLGEPLHGRHALVVGAGTIGRSIARKARALEMVATLVARRRRPDPEFGIVHGVEELPALLPLADFLVLAAPLTPETRGLIGRAALQRLKPGARLINLGRGPLVDEASLVEALSSGRLAGAALDVFWEEPLPASHPLWGLPNVVISPHMSGDVRGYERWFVQHFLDNLERWLGGQPLQHVVDKRLGYVPGD